MIFPLSPTQVRAGALCCFFGFFASFDCFSKGGEGKSRIGLILRELFGSSMYTGSLQKVETNRFARADLEYKLLLVDDDMKTEALPQTNNIKTLVTLEDKIDIERKGQQSVQGTLYVRFACFRFRL